MRFGGMPARLVCLIPLGSFFLDDFGTGACTHKSALSVYRV
jgi:hypothetical protein